MVGGNLLSCGASRERNTTEAEMAKIGRNDACPCGSGKKYKKCCLNKDREETRLRNAALPAGGSSGGTTSSPSGMAAAAGSLDGLSRSPDLREFSLHPYVIAKMSEESGVLAELEQRDPVEAARFWSIGKVAALETIEILSKLREFGVDASPEAFLPLTADRTSAWDLAGAWRDELRRARGGDLPRHDDDFLGLAACELWKRTCPERPSKEMLDDWMQEGYKFSMEHQPERACERWQQVWDVIRERLTPQMRDCRDAEVVFNGMQCVHNWVQDFQFELRNVAVKEARYAAQAVSLCEEVLAHFPGESELFTINSRADLGEFLFLADRPDEGEGVLLQLIDDHPDHPAGYARLSDMLGFGLRPGEPPADRERAIALLDRALARPVKDPGSWGVQSRLEELGKLVEPVSGDRA